MSRWIIPLFVDVLKPEQGLVDDPGGLGRRQLAARPQDVLQSVAVEVLHHDVIEALAMAHLVGADDVGVLQLDGQAGPRAGKRPNVSLSFTLDGGSTLMATRWPSWCMAS